MAKQNKTIYSKIVSLKKRFIKKQIIPDKFARIIDAFFNGLHNSLIISRDMTRDALIKSHDLAKGSLIRSRDMTRDALIKSHDLTRDVLIKSKDTARDLLERSKDMTRDALLSIKSDQNSNQFKIGILKNLAFPIVFLKNLAQCLFLEIKLMKFLITEKSDKEAVLNIQKIIANSKNVSERIKKFYNKESIVINPHVRLNVMTQEQCKIY